MDEKKDGLLRDGKGNLSSFRVMEMVVGSIVLIGKAFGLGCDAPGYETTLTFLFAAALGGKVGQKFAEK